MKHPFPKENQARFSGGVRHYHRTGAPPRPSWEEWVDGAGAGKKRPIKWLKILGIVLAVLVLATIIAGLYIELR